MTASLRWSPRSRSQNSSCSQASRNLLSKKIYWKKNSLKPKTYSNRCVRQMKIWSLSMKKKSPALTSRKSNTCWRLVRGSLSLKTFWRKLKMKTRRWHRKWTKIMLLTRKKWSSFKCSWIRNVPSVKKRSETTTACLRASSLASVSQWLERKRPPSSLTIWKTSSSRSCRGAKISMTSRQETKRKKSGSWPKTAKNLILNSS